MAKTDITQKQNKRRRDSQENFALEEEFTGEGEKLCAKMLSQNWSPLKRQKLDNLTETEGIYGGLN